MNIILNEVVSKRIDTLLVDPPHALAVHAPKGAGKSHAALHIISRILSIDEQQVYNYPYISIIDASSKDVGIDTIRDIQKSLSVKVPNSNVINRFILIENIDQLGHEGQTALLKTIEEPPQATMIIITFVNGRNVLPTIFSRTQVLELSNPLLEDYSRALSKLNTQDEITSKYHMSGGNAATLLTFLDNDQNSQTLAIQSAKELLLNNRYNRLAKVDGILKQQEFTPSELLNGIHIILQGSLGMSANNNKDIPDNLLQRIEYVEQSLDDMAKGVQPKLVLSTLFSAL